MKEAVIKYLRKFYNKLAHGISFVPGVIGLGFLILAIISLQLDHQGIGEDLNSRIKWLTVEDAESARTIVATVCAGILSLTVFTFSMVVIVMNQAASQMSNRMLDTIIADKRQKITLGCFIGTIVFALFLLVNISKTESFRQVPSFTVYMLLLITIFDIFLFINFLNYITQSFRYEQLIQRIYRETIKNMPAVVEGNSIKNLFALSATEYMFKESGFFQSFNKKRLLALATNKNLAIEFLSAPGNYILKGTPLFKIFGTLNDSELANVYDNIDFYFAQEIDNDFYYGFFHLAEVGIKALSPGINDPGTAVLSIGAFTDLFSRLAANPPFEFISDKQAINRIKVKRWHFEELFEASMLHIWDYGKNDRKVKKAFQRSIEQLLAVVEVPKIHNYLLQFKNEHLQHQKKRNKKKKSKNDQS